MIISTIKKAIYWVISLALVAGGLAGCNFGEARVDGPWIWAKSLTLDEVVSVKSLETNEEFSPEEVEKLVSAINQLEEKDFTEEKAFNGGMPSSGLVIKAADELFFLTKDTDLDGPLEMNYGGQLWKINNASLGEFFAASTPEPSPTATPVPESSNIFIDLATDELLAEYSEYKEVDASMDEYGVKVLIRTDGKLKKFRVFKLVFDEGTQELYPSSDKAYFQADELNKEIPVLITVSFPGAFPTVGVGFKDEKGVSRIFHIVMSGEDGSILLTEATPQSSEKSP